MEQKILQGNMDGIAAKGIAAYCDDRIAVIDQIDKIEELKDDVRMEIVMAVLCLKGEIKIELDDQTHLVQGNDLLICRPNVIIGKSTASPDLQVCCIAMSPNYVHQLFTIANNTWDVVRFLEKSPVIHLYPEEAKLFCQYHDLIRSKLTGTPYRHQKEVVDSLLQAFIYEFHDAMERFVQLNPPTYSSYERLFKEFLELLTSSYPKERMVAAYAEKLCVTPKYLSAVCKEISGNTASGIINKYVIKDVLYLLKKSDKSIKEIANELDFPNLSFFGKYVKRYTGLSPKQYREHLIEEEKQ